MIHDVHAELVAQVLELSVEPGHRVAAGDTLALLETMKMEIPVLAEHGGLVVATPVRAGDVVRAGEVLVSLEVTVTATR